ncbi:ABC transporter permease [Candidatus Nitrosacidococcus tergens]|uniref:ABC transporter permease n=1 Tax=Candidatus Nitrosacidococcus tergens TaxID=553981 RepID=A0A7G1QAH5_9GAMM|nr:FtsX-like permease family protein [Candidatus Nitrosacidococcus tergens]CAB1276036.1 conserved membrane protein of unknown function [Candidatus Nitrosacidococcus tergens]
MISFFWRISWRSLFNHPWQILLTLLGIILGVAVVIAIDLANGSAYQSFTLTANSMAGRATHEIISGPSGLDEKIYTQLRLTCSSIPAAPVLEGFASLAGDETRLLRVLGVDPFAEAPFRDYINQKNNLAEIDLTALLTEPNTIILEQATAQVLHVALKDKIPVVFNNTTHLLTVVGIFKEDILTQKGLSQVLITDIATAQEILDQIGTLTRIDLIFPADEQRIVQENQIKHFLPAGTILRTTNERSQALRTLTGAFKINLTALSLLALLVGAFIVFNTITFLWLQRRRTIGLLRTLGVTQQQIFLLLVAESLGIGIVGSIGGIFLGIFLAQILLDPIIQTFNDLYAQVQVQGLFISLSTLFKGALLGIGATLVATIIPALEIVHTPPGVSIKRAPLEAQARRWIKGAALIGSGLFMLGVIISFIPSKSIILGFLGVTGVLIGGTLLAPVFGTFLLKVILPFLKNIFGTLGQLSARSIIASLSRSGIAMAALTLAVAATIGIGIMISSFRHSVNQWLLITLQADLYVSTTGTHTGPDSRFLDPQLVTQITQLPETQSVSTTYWLRLESEDSNPTDMVIFNPAPQSIESFQFVAGNPQKAWDAFLNDEAVLISEPYATHHQLSPGSKIVLPTVQGSHAFTVSGVYFSYGSNQGVVTVHKKNYERYWSDSKVSSVGIYVKPHTDFDALRSTLFTLISPNSGVEISTNREVRDLSLEIFDRTFAITKIVRFLAGLIAFAGILSALMALQLERTREFGTLRAIGVTPHQIRWLIIGQTGLMGIICGLLAIPLGLVSAAGLIYIINYRSFGWTMGFHIDSMELFQGILLALIASLLAGIYPAWRASQVVPAITLYEE